MSLINREDAIEVIKSMTVTLGGKEIFGPNAKQSVIDVLDLQPSVDVIEVVRCKDCAYYRPSPFGHPKNGWCTICGHHRPHEYYRANANKKEKKNKSD